MEDIQQEYESTTSAVGPPKSLVGKLKDLERHTKLKHLDDISKKESKDIKWPFKWKQGFGKANKASKDQVVVVMLNKKGELEQPKLMPIYAGNLIVWDNTVYEFDPRAVVRIKGLKKYPMAYLIKQIDRRPVSNLDLDEIRARGDSTESDEFLIKAALKAQTAKLELKSNMIIIAIVILLIIGLVVYFLSSKGAT